MLKAPSKGDVHFHVICNVKRKDRPFVGIYLKGEDKCPKNCWHRKYEDCYACGFNRCIVCNNKNRVCCNCKQYPVCSKSCQYHGKFLFTGWTGLCYPCTQQYPSFPLPPIPEDWKAVYPEGSDEDSPPSSPLAAGGAPGSSKGSAWGAPGSSTGGGAPSSSRGSASGAPGSSAGGGSASSSSTTGSSSATGSAVGTAPLSPKTAAMTAMASILSPGGAPISPKSAAAGAAAFAVMASIFSNSGLSIGSSASGVSSSAAAGGSFASRVPSPVSVGGSSASGVPSSAAAGGSSASGVPSSAAAGGSSAPSSTAVAIVIDDEETEEEKRRREILQANPGIPAHWDLDNLKKFILKSIFKDGSPMEEQYTSQIKEVFGYLEDAESNNMLLKDKPPSPFHREFKPFKVKEIKEVQNYYQLKKYQLAKQILIDKGADPTTVESIGFHGTNKISAENMADIGPSGIYTEFHAYGRGVYFGDQCHSIPVEYASQKGRDPAIIIGPMLVGKNGLTSENDCKPPPGYDSGGSGSKWIVVLFENDRFYGKYIVYIEFCGDYQMLSQKAKIKQWLKDMAAQQAVPVPPAAPLIQPPAAPLIQPQAVALPIQPPVAAPPTPPIQPVAAPAAAAPLIGGSAPKAKRAPKQRKNTKPRKAAKGAGGSGSGAQFKPTPPSSDESSTPGTDSDDPVWKQPRSGGRKRV